MIARIFGKKKNKVMALTLSAAILLTCVSLALVGTLAAPGDFTETFVNPYSSDYLPIDLGGTRNLDVINAFNWSSSDTSIIRVTRDNVTFTRAYADGLRLGTCAITAGTRNGLIDSRPFYVRDMNNIISYTFEGGSSGNIANVNGMLL